MLGKIVLFKLDEHSVREIFCINNKYNKGNLPSVGEQVPAVIVKVWGPNCVNLKLLIDGPQDLWVTSAMFGDGPRQCQLIPETCAHCAHGGIKATTEAPKA